MTLSKTKKKPGLERKGKVVAEIKDAVEKYSSAYVFTFDNMRNQKLKDLREQLKSSSRYPPLVLLLFCLLILFQVFFSLPSNIQCCTAYSYQQTLLCCYIVHKP